MATVRRTISLNEKNDEYAQRKAIEQHDGILSRYLNELIKKERLKELNKKRKKKEKNE